MPTETIPLFGSFTNRGDVTKDQQFFNCFPQVAVNSLSNTKDVHLFKRGGVVQDAETASGNLSTYGACVWLSKADNSSPGVMSFLNSTSDAVRVYRQSTGATFPQVGGDIANTKNCFTITDTVISTVGNLVGVMQDSTSSLMEAWFFPEGGAWTQITDADFPPNQATPLPIRPNIAHLDGFMFAMCENGQIWNSDVNSLANWTATSFITASSSPDGGVGIARYKDYIVGFGKSTVQFFYNAGNAVGSPLSPVRNATINVGALRSATFLPTIKEIGTTVYWIGVNMDTGVPGVYRLNGQQAEKISNQTVDKMINNGLVAAIAGGFSMGGKQHIMFESSVTAAYNICYCVDNDFWWTLLLAGQVRNVLSVVNSGGDIYFNNYTSLARVYRFSDGVFQDNAVAYSLISRTAGVDFGTDKRKFITKIWLDADTQASGTTLLERSVDDYASWTTVGTFDNTLHEKLITRCGSHTGEAAYRLTHSANTAWRGKALRFEYTVAP